MALTYNHSGDFFESEKTFFDKFISGQDIKYMVCTQDYIEHDKANEIVMAAINNWKKAIKKYIFKSKEKEKLADILQFVEASNMIEIPCSETEKADLTVKFTQDPDDCGFGAGGCMDVELGIAYLNASRKYRPKYKMILSHEFGHAFGLGDFYKGSRTLGSFLYNSRVHRPSIMDYSEKVTCDDVDGFITVVDRARGIEREFYSVCKDGLLIKNGKGIPIDNPKYKISDKTEEFDVDIEKDDYKNQNHIELAQKLINNPLSDAFQMLTTEFGTSGGDEE